MFYDNNDHSDYLGFTWQRCMIGKVPVGIDSDDTDFNLIGKTGGEKTHTLTKQEMPSHQHRLTITGGGNVSASGVNWQSGTNMRYYSGDMIEAVGGGKAHNILQPYEVVSYWRRIS